MKPADRYTHYKGNLYYFSGIALPLMETTVESEIHTLMTLVREVRYHENTHDLSLYMVDGILFIDADKPHVIYFPLKEAGEQQVWAREVDDFFGYTHNADGEFVKRFTKQE